MNEGWIYECALGRLPIFMLGIMTVQKNNIGGKFMLLALSIFALVYSAFKGCSFALCFLAIFSIPILLKIPKWNIFEKVGEYTLELYAANVITGSLISKSDNIFEGYFQYIVLQILISIEVIKFNSLIRCVVK